MTLTLTILGCGSSAGVPRPALGWGACDPDKSEKPPPPLFAAGRTNRQERHDADRDRHLTGPARAIDRRRGRSYRCGVSHPRARRSDPRDRRSALGGAASAPTYSGLFQPSRPPTTSCCRFSYCFIIAARQRLSADPGAPRDRGGRKPDDRREGRRCNALSFQPYARQYSSAGLSDRRRRLYARRQRYSQGELAVPGKSRSLDHRWLALCRPSQPFQRQRRAVLDRAFQAKARRHHQHAFRSGLRGAAAKPAGQRDPRL